MLVKFKADLTPEQIKESEAAFRGLKSKIDVIKDFEWGTDVSVEGKAEGFTHLFLVSFADEKGRDIYLPHAAHKEFVTASSARGSRRCWWWTTGRGSKFAATTA